MKQPSIIDIVMTTYNQEDHVAKAIESVLCQKTDLPFRLIIGEDCSTDKTYLICKEYAVKYPEIITLLENDQNLGLVKNYKRCFEASQGKYIAILEGDDYWTSQYKLDLQFSLINSDSEIGLVHSNYMLLKGKQLINNPNRLIQYSINNQGYIYEKLICNNFICPLTAMFKRELLLNIDFDFMIEKKLQTIDYFLWLSFSINKKIAYQNEIFGVYRISPKSISNNALFSKRVQFEVTKQEILNFFIKANPVKNFNINKYQDKANMLLLLRSIKTFDLLNFLKYIRMFSFNGLIEAFKSKLAILK